MAFINRIFCSLQVYVYFYEESRLGQKYTIITSLPLSKLAKVQIFVDHRFYHQLFEQLFILRATFWLASNFFPARIFSYFGLYFSFGGVFIVNAGEKIQCNCLRWLPPVLHFPEPLNFTKGFLAHHDGLVPVLARWCYNSF